MRRAELKSRIVDVVDAALPNLVEVSHRIHARPETAWNEHEAVRLLTDRLSGLGFTVQLGVAGLPTAFVASFGSGCRRIAVVAEYDALPGLGHACGHNVIAAAALGAATALAPLADDLDLEVLVIGTPAEEGGGGKIPLLDAGCFDGLLAAMMVHPGPSDAVYARPRAVAHFEVTFRGVSAHAGAYPERGVNAADALTVAQVAIGLLRQHLPDSARVHGVVTTAGDAANAVPDLARGTWYVRADTLADLDAIFLRVRDCFAAGALATGCTWELVETSPRYAEFRNDEPLVAAFAANAAALGREMDLAEAAPRGMASASTDMGNVSQRVPAIHPYLSIDCSPALNHTRQFAAAAAAAGADRAVRDGAVLLAQTVVDLLDPDKPADQERE